MRSSSLPALMLALIGLAAAPSASAATISLLPASADVMPGELVSLDLVIAGLGFAEAPSLGDFDIDIAFDPAALDFVDYMLGTELGDLGAGEAIDVSFGLFAPGGVNVAEVSLLSVGALEAGQPDTFVLATLQFMVTGLGVGEMTAIDISGVFALGDANGDPIPVDGTSGTVLTGVAIPLPAGLWLLASALLLVASRRH